MTNVLALVQVYIYSVVGYLSYAVLGRFSEVYVKSYCYQCLSISYVLYCDMTTITRVSVMYIMIIK